MIEAKELEFKEPESESAMVLQNSVGSFFFAFLVGMVFLGGFARLGHVFTYTQLSGTIMSNAPTSNVFYANQAFSTSKSNYFALSTNLVARYFKSTPDSNNGPELRNLEKVIQFEQTQLNLLKPPFDLVPFYPYLLTHANGITPLWLFCFAFLFFALPPNPRTKQPWWAWLKLFHGIKTLHWRVWFFSSVIVIVIFRWNLWHRNFGPWNEGRTLYAYSNYDVSPCAFFATEIVDTVAMVLVTLVWAKYLRIYSEFNNRFYAKHLADFEYATSPEVLSDLSRDFVRWQVSSVFIALPLLLSTFFYYDIIFRTHDDRYFPQAINSHLLWGVTWLICSLCLLREHYEWMTAKVKALAEHGQPHKVRVQRAELFEKIQPLSAANRVASAIIAAGSFLFPLIHAIWK